MNKKKLIAILTLVCFMFTLVPVAAMAEENTICTEEKLREAVANASTDSQNPTVIEIGADIVLSAILDIGDSSTARYVTLKSDNGSRVISPVASGFNTADSGYALLRVMNGALTLEDITVSGGDRYRTVFTNATNGKGTLYIEDGATLTNGKKSGGTGGAIMNYGTTYMNGGVIKDSYADQYGGAVCTGDANVNSLFVMNGGSIRNCTAKLYGAAIHARGGELHLLGGTITDNKQNDGDSNNQSKAAVFVQNTTKVFLGSDMTIEKNTDSAGKTVGLMMGQAYTSNVIFTISSALTGQIDLSLTRLGISSSVPNEIKAAENYTITTNDLTAFYVYDDYAMFLNTTANQIQNVPVQLNGGMIKMPYENYKVNELPIPKLDCYTAQWCTDEALTTALQEVPTANTTHYAKWVSEITFDANGGILTDTEAITVDKAEAIGTLPEVERTGYTFNGWYTAAVGSEAVTTDTIPEGDTTYYAQWTANQYIVNFNLNGGTGVTPQALTMTYDVAGDAPTNTVEGKKFGKAGYHFVGWSLDQEITSESTIYTNEISNLTTENGAGVTLYAIWGECSHDSNTTKHECDREVVCSICGGTLPALGHDYTESTIWVAVDADNHAKKCSRCDAVGSENKVTHSYATDCDADCDVCGYERVAGEHAYTWTSNGNGTHSGICDCGAAVTNDCTYGENGKCTVCGYKEPEDEYIPSSSSSSGFTGSYNYPVSTPEVNNGDVKLSDSNAIEGESVTATITPDNGYGVAEVIVTDEDGNIIPVEFIGNGQYTFTMPDSKVSVEVVCKPAITMKIGDTLLNIFGKTMQNDVAPTIGEGNRTMLPIRAVANALGAEVYWGADNQKVTIVKDGKVIEVFIGKDYAFVDGERSELDAKAYIENNRTYLQLRFVTEALDAEVIWDPVKRMITIIPE